MSENWLYWPLFDTIYYSQAAKYGDVGRQDRRLVVWKFFGYGKPIPSEIQLPNCGGGDV